MLFRSIAAIVLIGNAGYERVAILGFHSQAGWIAFNLTAFGIAVLAQRTPWVSRVAHRNAVAHPRASSQNPAAGANPTAAYLMPLLAILAAGMISHALSAGFEFLYPLRFVAALALSALAFGLMHGALWLPGIAAGLAYGALAVRTDKLGESVAAHATTNALLAAYVLMFDRWQLW